MSSKEKTAKELEKLSKRFLAKDTRKVLLDSLENDKTEWFTWVSQIKAVLRSLSKAENAAFSGLALLMEQRPKSNFHQDNLKRFLISKAEYYRHYDFSLEKQLKREKEKRGNLWISKVLRLFISRSFLGILILVLILGFILWFYLDRESCLEFVQKVIQPFLKAIR
ncbi:MAG: hypothetical protein ABH889_03345 [Candidatus Portnoybacteria bacterium]